MCLSRIRAGFVLAAVLVCAPPSRAATMTFNPAGSDVSAVFGASGSSPNSPGQVVYEEDGIAMSVEEFLLGGSSFFVAAEIGGRFSPIFPTPVLELSNISTQFDLTGAGFDVDLFTLEFFEMSVVQNFSVNGQTIRELSSLIELNNLAVEVAPGVVASVNIGPIIAGELNGLLTIQTVTSDAAITRVLVGGQELLIDNIVAVPEPTCALLLGAGVVALWRRRGCRAA